jgi:hypothetical protein
MSERNEMVIALVKEVLGPRQGSIEIMPDDDDPRNEYITGVLAPAEAIRPPDDIEEDIDEVIEETSGEEDQDTQGFVGTPGVFSPALDPKSQPRSIGISFSIASTNGGHPAAEICVTWARYQHVHEGWQREPVSYLTGPVQLDADLSRTAGSGIRLFVRSHQVNDGWHVSIYLVNETPMANEYPVTSEFIFQPQIRVICCDGSELIPVRTTTGPTHAPTAIPDMDVNAREDAKLGLLYRNRLAMARGHMCAVMWRAIDPERPYNSEPVPQSAPFIWTDRDSVPEKQRNRFSPADVRTELVPCYPIQTPGMSWDDAFGQSPVLKSEALAECWNPAELRSSLQPLIAGYTRWIEQQRNVISQLNQEYQAAAITNLLECEQIANRMLEAIEILCTDDESRLAFCFANKALHLQSVWKDSRYPLIWRPFQIAFILLNIPPLAQPEHPSRDICDLLWFPTGGGKTESYLGLAAFVLGLRRLRAQNHDLSEDRTGGGAGVLSRYTLRLLTIQQFRRTLGVITACEMLRVWNLDTAGGLAGWRPRDCHRGDPFIWGGLRFSIGLWVGGGVTPNNLFSIGPMPVQGQFGMTMIAGALDILQGAAPDYTGPNQQLANNIQQTNGHLQVEGEPAQVTNCPCCRSILAVPEEGLAPGQHRLHFVYRGGNVTSPNLALLRPRQGVTIDSANLTNHAEVGYHTLSISFTINGNQPMTPGQVDEWWNAGITQALGRNVELTSARPARPGYFILTYPGSKTAEKPCDFDIYCPNPECDLNNHEWAEQIPLNRNRTGAAGQAGNQMMLGLPAIAHADGLPTVLQDRLEWQDVPTAFRVLNTQRRSTRIPIPALTVDDQLYSRCPSMVIATVDKFARLPYEPKASALFGNVSQYHSRWGYYREGCPPSSDTPSNKYNDHPPVNNLHQDVFPFYPPDLILQDELHLIEGPLGSMVGIYETVIDLLARREAGGRTIMPKYIASTATVRQAESQVQSLFNRRLAQFPPSAITADDRFFAVESEIHPLDTQRSGRLYVAICAPGKGAQTPIVRIWSSLLQGAEDLLQTSTPQLIDPFWTLVGYFNATRELAGALSLYRQDIPERIQYHAGNRARVLDENRKLELSSRASSTNLPILLQRLESSLPQAQDSVFATSMFGTGVDIDRLSLMVVHGQPKTTASYIQATGRVGRKTSGLVVSFFRASRPRDLDHYEFFTGYHRALYRYVEPVTVAPYSPRARDRALGPLAVALLRQAKYLPVNILIDPEWRIQQRIGSQFHSQACRMAQHRFDPEVEILPSLFEQRASIQPEGRRPQINTTGNETRSELDRWHSIAARFPHIDQFVYNEPAMMRPPQRHVVLGDSQHHRRFEEAFDNAPQSLRDVEETTGFKA